jgi:hypothetical protein
MLEIDNLGAVWFSIVAVWLRRTVDYVSGRH